MTDSTSPKPLRIAVIGGGIGGLWLRNWPPKLSSHHLHHLWIAQLIREIGARIGFTSNGHRGTSVKSPDVHESYRTIALFSGIEEKRYVASRYLVGEAGVDEEKAIIEVNLPLGLKQSSAHRKDLLDLIASCLPGGSKVCTEFEKRLMEIKDGRTER